EGRARGGAAAVAAVGPSGRVLEPPHAESPTTAIRTAMGVLAMFSGYQRAPRIHPGLVEYRLAPGKQLVHGRLNPLPDLLAQLQDQAGVPGGVRAELSDLDRTAERDEPFRRQRDEPGDAEPRKWGGDAQCRQAQQAGQRLEASDHRLDLLRADHRDRDE